jgi:hypothetical protein
MLKTAKLTILHSARVCEELKRIMLSGFTVKDATLQRNHRVAHKGNRPFEEHDKTRYDEANELGFRILTNFFKCYADHATYFRNTNFTALQERFTRLSTERNSWDDSFYRCSNAWQGCTE